MRVAEERAVHLLVLVRVGVDDDRAAVGVERVDVRRELAELGRRVRVLLPEVPVEGEVVAEAGDELAVVQLPLGPERPAVERLVVLRLLRLKVQEHPEAVGVREHDLPLGQLGDVVAEPGLRGRAGRRPRPHVAAVALGVVEGEEAERVHPLRREVVEGADEPLPLAAVPRRVARVPVLDVRAPRLEADRPGPAQVGRVVEVGVGQEVLGAVGPALDEVVAVVEPEVPLADVAEDALPAVVAAVLDPVARLGGDEVERRARAARRAGVVGDGHARALVRLEANGPRAGRERGVGPPLVPRRRPGVGRVPVGGEVAGDGEPDRPVVVARELDVEPVVQERVGRALLAQARPVDRDRDRVPRHELARGVVRALDGELARAAGAVRVGGPARVAAVGDGERERERVAGRAAGVRAGVGRRRDRVRARLAQLGDGREIAALVAAERVRGHVLGPVVRLPGEREPDAPDAPGHVRHEGQVLRAELAEVDRVGALEGADGLVRVGVVEREVDDGLGVEGGGGEDGDGRQRPEGEVPGHGSVWWGVPGGTEAPPPGRLPQGGPHRSAKNREPVS